ncbi:MAG: type II toxin-antitoxin system VapC family toxin [Phenylobacterium sp.]|nr:type II toxin-antitoxin system VapC family toxin [Phenylobacterium sp.]
MILFCDTSALVKLYLREDGSEAMQVAAAGASALAVSRIAWAEAFSALARRAREVPADEPAIELARQRMRGHWRNYMVVEVTQPLVEQAGDFAETFALRAYDSIQLASAVTLHHGAGEEVGFACYDNRLRKAARVLGMRDQPEPQDRLQAKERAAHEQRGYRIVKEASLRASLRRYKDLGDPRWLLFEALLRCTTYEEYMAEVGGFEHEIPSRGTGKPWKATAENCYNYLMRNGRIEEVA